MESRHPVQRHRAFVIQSPPLLELEAVFESKLRGGELSLCVYGPPRVGKTSALKYLANNLKSEKLAAVRKTFIEKQQQPSRIDRAEFWRSFSDTRIVTPPSWCKPAGAYAGLLNGLMVESDTLGTDTVVIMVDEAQNLVVQHFSMLKQLLDELIDFGRSPFLLLSAQPEIRDRPAQFVQRNLHDLVDRFFTQWHRMRGLLSSEFEGFLHAYDELCWPPNGEVNGIKPHTFTGYFAPVLAAHGGLMTLTPYFQDYFRQVSRDLRGKADDEVETKFLVAAVRLVLLELKSTPDLQSPKKIAAVIKKAINECGISESRRRVGDAELLNKQPSKPRRICRVES